MLSLGKTGRHPSQRTRHLNVRYFFIFDRVAKGEILLEYLETKKMIADLMTKPVNGILFQLLTDALFGITPCDAMTHDVRGVLKGSSEYG